MHVVSIDSRQTNSYSQSLDGSEKRLGTFEMSRRFLLCAIVLCTGCEVPTEPNTPTAYLGLHRPIDPVSIIIDTAGPLLRTLSVDLQKPARIAVDYWTGGSPRLRVMSKRRKQHSILLARLVPDAMYDFEVRAANSPDSRQNRTPRQFPLGHVADRPDPDGIRDDWTTGRLDIPPRRYHNASKHPSLPDKRCRTYCQRYRLDW